MKKYENEQKKSGFINEIWKKNWKLKKKWKIRRKWKMENGKIRKKLKE